MDRFEQRKATRARLIDAALKLFSTSGYEHATIDDISQAAGYSKGAYYFHFSTKEDILLELLRRWSEDRTTALAAAGGGADAEPNPRAMLGALFSYEAEARWPGAVLEFWAQSLRLDEVKKRLTQAYGGWRHQLAGMFERAAVAGQLSIESADEAAGVALAAHDGYAVQMAIGSPSGPLMTPAQLADALVSPLEQAPERRRATAI
jgi:AcrR family transcriptional regulator